MVSTSGSGVDRGVIEQVLRVRDDGKRERARGGGRWGHRHGGVGRLGLKEGACRGSADSRRDRRQGSNVVRVRLTCRRVQPRAGAQRTERSATLDDPLRAAPAGLLEVLVFERPETLAAKARGKGAEPFGQSAEVSPLQEVSKVTADVGDE